MLRQRGLRASAPGFCLLLLLILPAQAAEDRHAGYYYPEAMTREVYEARVQTFPQADRKRRVAFVTGFTAQMRNRPHAPTWAMFAKGAGAEKLIIVALQDGPLDTLFRARAVLAGMTATARLLPIFNELGGQDVLTFFDLAKMLGFTQITVSDGRHFSHQVILL
jgi:hypothetical protein